MSTRCLICKKLPDGKVRGIYCHHDGNLRWVGRMLLDCYTDEKKIDELLNLGAISSLGKTPDHADGTEAFQRDLGRSAEGNRAFVREAGREVETGGDIEYVYLWRGDGWYCAVLHNGNESYEWLPNIVGTEL